MSNQDEETKDLTANLSDRQLLELLLQRLDRLETRFEGRDTNPLLPPDFTQRFEGMERDIHEMKLDLRVMREDLDRERRTRVEMNQRLEKLEKQAA